MLQQLAELHKQCYPERPWGADEFADLKKAGCDVVGSQNGFIVYRATLDEAELISIGVAPGARGGGIAQAMLGIMDADLKKRGVKKIFLEVAENNAPARRLYEKCGYVQIGRRPKYYNGIDAIMMEKTL